MTAETMAAETMTAATTATDGLAAEVLCPPATATATATATAPGTETATAECGPAVRGELVRALFGDDHRAGHGPWRALLTTEPFRRRSGLAPDAQLRLAYGRLRTLNSTLDSALRLAADPVALANMHEWLSPVDAALTTVAGIHYNLFLGTLLDHDSDSDSDGDVRRDLSGFADLTRVGTFLCTEIDHGNDATALQTTARYDRARDGFLLRTPHAGAQKFMPNTSTAGGPKSGVVAARLLVDGRDLGVFLFLTALTGTEGPLPGVRVRLLPRRMGSVVDHCLTSFDDVFVPRGSLLSGPQGRLGADGTFSSEVANRRSRFLLSIGRVTAGKLSMSAAAVGSVRAALAVAVRHGSHRLIGGVRAPERVPVMAHRSHYAPLAGALATAYAMTLLHRTVLRTWTEHERTEQDRTEQDGADGAGRAEAERLVAVAKAWITWEARGVITECRERCGAQGLLENNGLAALVTGIEGAITAEGDNMAIHAKAAAQMVSGHSPARPPTDPAGRELTDPVFLRELLAAVECLELDRARAGMAAAAPGDALGRWNAGATAALRAATAHAQLRAAEAVAAAADALPPGSAAAELLHTLGRLFALERIAPRSGDLLNEGFVEGRHIAAIPAETDRLAARVAGEAQVLTEAFDLPAEWLADVPVAGAGYASAYDDPEGPWHRSAEEARS
ncbi:acyl-CoA dehydrogenase [Streptomyces sp. NBC_01180]|uniref:acyl-CoA dehydrogenase family protein n=1 Tax=Streptomyces sp. NBC_01180 TaxID=2903763 RepID=UPI00386CFD1C